MNQLWLYAKLSHHLRARYRPKLMGVVFAGIQLPWLVLIAFIAWNAAPGSGFTLKLLSVAAAATLVATVLTLLALSHLLRPVMLTSSALRAYVARRALPDLPTGWKDEAGTLMADTAHTITQLDAALDELASHDAITGLPNRERLLRRTSGQMAAGPAFALCVLAQQNHQRVVAAFGQEAADAVIRTLGQSLAAALGREAILASVGANQFAFIVTDGQPAMDHVMAALPQEIAADGAVCIPELAVGIALWPADGDSPEALLNAALAAVPPPGSTERAAFYAVASRDTMRERLSLERDLHRALERDEFRLYYQPVISLPSGRIVSAEALLRWQHPQHGLIPPARFMPVLESSGLADAAGLWVLGAACRQLRTWSDDGLTALRVAINLSAAQFRRPSLVDTIKAALAAHGVAPARLEIELTETMMMHDAAHTSAQFARLQAIGVTTAIDDFGTGYSSLGYLKSLAFDKLKIDRSFVAGVDTARDSQAICAALIELARRLGIVVQAEGTETDAEVAMLRRLGCHLFQGYVFAPPLCAADLAARLRQQQAAELAPAA